MPRLLAATGSRVHSSARPSGSCLGIHGFCPHRGVDGCALLANARVLALRLVAIHWVVVRWPVRRHFARIGGNPIVDAVDMENRCAMGRVLAQSGNRQPSVPGTVQSPCDPRCWTVRIPAFSACHRRAHCRPGASHDLAIYRTLFRLMLHWLLVTEGVRMAKQLIRSKTDCMLGGVCGGLGVYFDFDPNLIRLLFVILAVAPGIGIPAYIALWLLVPEESQEVDAPLSERIRDGAEEIADRARHLGDQLKDKSGSAGPKTSFAVGAVLIVVGIGFLLRNLGFTWMNWVARIWVWPSLLIVVGLVFLWRWIRDRTD